ncbi:HPr family phosphocarrier protein [Ktedonospora formicarum]|uniref:HPr domain-containing protein n=1 Tax=Ktedonospora formicarum TaxID=2778364 RepID=A0A8J3ID78_9CHLR|nr:HPr family phosphocarrier protein [Ktedonospora formicarum]GHO50103.1 hypothetical protein KSX_82660 [Ktedonospora formicarum]
MAAVEAILNIRNKVGLHARPARLLVQTAACFDAEIHLLAGGKVANAKSILAVLKLGVPQGSELRVRAEGVDANEAVEALSALAARNFDEDE